MTSFQETAPARLATRLAFFAAGFTKASWAPFIPFIKDGIGADEGVFGLLLLCLGIGAIVAMPIAGAVSARSGPKKMVVLGGIGALVMLPLLVSAGSPITVGVVILLFGASLGTIDVAMNVHGAEIEGIEKRPLMSNFHALSNVGGLCGAALMTLLLFWEVPLVFAALIGSVVALCAMLLTGPRLLLVKGDEPEPFAFPHGIVLLLAFLAGITFLTEGAVLDWSALLIVERGLSSMQSAGVGYIVFSAAMIIGRLTGDRIVAALGGFRVLLWGGVIASVGVLTTALADWTAMAIAGFALIGIGAANLVPIFFSAAGRQKLMPAGLAVASVTTTGYAGVLMGPAMIGFVAQATSLATAFCLLAALLTIVPLTAKIVVKV